MISVIVPKEYQKSIAPKTKEELRERSLMKCPRETRATYDLILTIKTIQLFMLLFLAIIALNILSESPCLTSL